MGSWFPTHSAEKSGKDGARKMLTQVWIETAEQLWVPIRLRSGQAFDSAEMRFAQALAAAFAHHGR
jgi:hypothetical protein